MEGAPSLDPSQTELYPDWKTLPAYLVKPGGALKLVERRRGDDPPEPDRLTLDRALWLDFDGRGFSARDRLQGRLGRSWRLESSPETVLGRVSAGGADQFLTALASGAPAGLEVRSRDVDVTADSRVEGRRLTASGWKHDFESVAVTLHLPPGWRLVHAFGADSARPTWVSSLTLLDFFLVLVASAAFLRLYGKAWGAVSLAGLALLWHEPGAPRWVWLAALLLAALDRALPAELSASRWVRLARRASLVALALIALPFFLTQIRRGAFPVLEYPYQSVQPRADSEPLGMDSGNQDKSAKNVGESLDFLKQNAARRGALRQLERMARAKQEMIAGAAAQMEAGAEEEPQEDAAEADDKDADMPMSAPAPAPMPSGKGMAYGSIGGSFGVKMKRPAPSYYSDVMTQMRLDPNARVNTGPGLPYWSWNSARIAWRGPVPQGHALRLWLLPPGANFALALARVLLTILLGLLLADLPVGPWLKSLLAPEGRAALKKALLPLALLALASGRASAADFPPQNLLDQLKARLTEAPACAPLCAESPSLTLKAAGDWLTMRFTVHAAWATAVPIPTGGRDWTPVRGTLDGAPVTVRRDGDGSLWAPVPAGAHELTLEGPLPQTDAVQLGLPLKPRRVDASLSGWNLHGLRENGRPEDNLQLSRARGAEPVAAAAAAARAQGTFPPFLRVERTVRLGLTWTVTTRVTRLSPLGAPVVVAVPLLPGESITSPDVRATEGKAQVSLPPQSPSVEWSSVLPETKTLALSAPAGRPWTESWRVEPGPLWHLNAKGLPPTFEREASGPRDLEYRPWPGETLTLDITRPGSVVGQTLTIDQSVLRLTPGVRATDATLAVRLRTSRGDRQTFVLPEGAELLAARVDGSQQPWWRRTGASPAACARSCARPRSAWARRR
ncbi:MAG: hypothetical protein HY079_09075 [Elusimicrobia bacterium]|nr:hypothetical protein [Elusimicrobiota bacterium]